MAFEKQISFAIILFIAAPYFTFAAEEVCKKTVDLKSCSKLKGLSVKSYGGTVLNEANCDILLPFEIFAKEPTIKFGAAKEDKLYTSLILEIHEKSDDVYELHMLKENILGSSLKKGNSTTGDDVLSYEAPTPSKTNEIHKFIFVVFEQKDGKVKLDKQERKDFKVDEWSKKVPLCGPTAGVQLKTKLEI